MLGNRSSGSASGRLDLLLELAPQLDKHRLSLRRDLTPEVQKDFEGGGTLLVEELKAACGDAVQVAGLFDGKHRRQLLPSNVHVERVGLHVKELARRAEAAKLAFNLDCRCAVRHQHSHRA